MTEHVIIDSRDGSRTDFPNKELMLAFLAHHAEIVKEVTLNQPYSLIAKIPRCGKVNEDDRPDSAA